MKLILACTCLLAPAALVAQENRDTTLTRMDSTYFVKEAKDTVSSGHKILKTKDGRPTSEGEMVHWVREGWWTIYRDNGSKLSEVNFVHNKGMQMKTFDEQGNLKETTFTLIEREAQFPGGDAAWNEYIRQRMMEKVDYLVKKKANGTIEVQYIIDAAGAVTNVECLVKTGTVLDEVALDIIKHAPNWVPAMQYGRNVKAYRRQKLTFQLPSK